MSQGCDVVVTPPPMNFKTFYYRAALMVGFCMIPAISRAETAFETFAGFYNSITLGDFYAVGADTEGRQLVTGDFYLSTPSGGYSVGYTVVGVPNLPQAGRDDLLIGGNFYGGTISTVTENAVLGGSVVSGSIGFDAAHSQSSGLGTLTTGVGLFDLDGVTGNHVAAGTGTSLLTLTGALKAESLALAGLASSSGVTIAMEPWELVVNISGSAGLKVVNLTAAQWNGGSGYSRYINVAPSAAGSTVVINVDGEVINLQAGLMTLTGISNQYVLVNYHEAQDWSSLYMQHEGSILAPFTETVDIQGSINGSAVFAAMAGEYVSKTSGAEFHNFLFRGSLPDDLTAVPEVSSSLLVLLGGLWLGGVRSRRRQKVQA